MRTHSYVVNSSHNNNKHPTQHKSINKIILNDKYINMVKYGDIVDGDLTEYEYSDSECSDSSVDETEEDEIQTNHYINRCNMARTTFKEKKKRAALLRAKASEDSFGSEICDTTNDSKCKESKIDHKSQNHINESLEDYFTQDDYESISDEVDDTMSCIYGRVKNGRGSDSFLGIVTDTGSGIPLISARYAEGLGLEFLPIPDTNQFDVNGAGGGKEKVKWYVYLTFDLDSHLVTNVNDQLELSMDTDRNIKLHFHLRFYVMAHLAVPALWGGTETRNLELTDHYQARGVTIKSPLRRKVYFIPTVSCTHLTNVLMAKDPEECMKEVWDYYRPDTRRLSSLCRGSESWNAAAILMPKSTTVINVVDDKGRFRGSTNECIIDQSEVDKHYGNMNVEVAASIHEGEAKIVLRNHSMYKINLACGTFRVKVNPIVVFPVLSITPTVAGGLPANLMKDDGRIKYEGDLEYHQKWPMKEESRNIHEVSRPPLFPEKLWDLVEPWEKCYVQNRFEKFQPERLASCVKEILENLDIMKRTTVMKMPWTKETVEEDDIFRAQALANLDAFFYANEDDVKAHHVMGDIDLIPGGRPFKCRPRRYSQVQQAFLEAKTGIMVEEGRLEHSTSDWSHGLVLVPYDDRITAFMEEFGENAMTEILKKENRVRVSTFFRLCLDLRQLNLQTVPDVYPLPRIDDLLDHIPRQIDRFSISDLADAFFLVELKSDKRHLTSFRTHNRQLQFAALPQGFINSPAIFSRFVDRVFNGLDRTRFSWYMDDTLNHSKGFMSHYFTQREAYNRLRIGNVTMKLSKTHINYDMMKFLGHLLFYDGRTPATDSVEAIAEWADPKDTTAVRSFLGATLYYREYIHQYSELAMPLYALTKKGVVVVDVWDDVIHGQAIRDIKQALTSKPVLLQVDNTKPFRLMVDACRKGHGLGGILEQQDNNDRWHPVAYFSKSLRAAERNYSATELECKVLHDAILHWSVYLKNVYNFDVFSDHNALVYMTATSNDTTNGRLMHYLMAIQGYRYTLYYRSGLLHCTADAVSRLLRRGETPVYETEDDLRDDKGPITRFQLVKARKIAAHNQVLEEKSQQVLRTLDKTKLKQLSIIQDEIVKIGVENLGTDEGRQRFLENLKAQQLIVDNAILDDLLPKIETTVDDLPVASSQKFVNLIKLNDFSECIKIQQAIFSAIKSKQTYYINSLLNNKPITEVDRLHDTNRVTLYHHKVDEANNQAKAILDNLLLKEECKSKHPNELIVVKEDKIEFEVGLLRRQIIDQRVLSLIIHPRLHPNTSREYRTLCNFVNQTEELNLPTDLTIDEILINPIQLVLPILPTLRRQTIGMQSTCFRDYRNSSSSVGKFDQSKLCFTLTRSGKGFISNAKTKTIEPIKKGSKSQSKANKNIGDMEYDPTENLDEHIFPQPKRATMLLTEESPLAQNLHAQRKLGHDKVTLMESTITGAGIGLFAYKNITENQVFAGYDGPHLTKDQLIEFQKGSWNSDYVAQLVSDHVTGEVIYIDGQAKDSFGAFANDPRNDHLVNAKLIWTNKGARVIATKNIFPGEEIFIDYGTEYWDGKLDKLTNPIHKATIQLRSQLKKDKLVKGLNIEKSCLKNAKEGGGVHPGSAKAVVNKNKAKPPIPPKISLKNHEDNLKYLSDKPHLVHFDNQVSMYPHAHRSDGHIRTEFKLLYDRLADEIKTNRDSTNPVTKSTLSNRLISDGLVEHISLETLHKVQRPPIDTSNKVQDILIEMEEDIMFGYDNLIQSEALADEMKHLVGRHFEDEGVTYEVTDIFYSTEFETVLAKKKTTSNKGKGRNLEDAHAHAVFGLEGVYELCERYLIDHPDDRIGDYWPSTSQEWAEHQRLDERLKAIIDSLEDNGLDEIMEGKNKFRLITHEDDSKTVLYRIFSDRNGREFEQRCIPRSLVKRALNLYHEGYIHNGAVRMESTIKLGYYWFKMGDEIREYVSKCINCKMRKSHTRKGRIPIMRYSMTLRPTDRTHLDLTGKLPKTKRGNVYILVIKDYLTKFVWLIPLPNKEAITIAEAVLVHFVGVAGVPKVIISDQGGEFDNKLMKAFTSVLTSKKIRTTGYNPQSDGTVEVHNRTLKDQLFHYVDHLKQDDWDTFLPTCQLMYNTTVSTATGYTPYFLMYGRECRMPSFQYMNKKMEESEVDVHNENLVYEMVKNMESFWEYTSKKVFEDSLRHNAVIRKPLAFKEYEVGQEFFRVIYPSTVFNDPDSKEAYKISRKLMERYVGPYKIIRKISPVQYDADIDGVITRVHALNMKPC